MPIRRHPHGGQGAAILTSVVRSLSLSVGGSPAEPARGIAGRGLPARSGRRRPLRGSFITEGSKVDGQIYARAFDRG